MLVEEVRKLSESADNGDLESIVNQFRAGRDVKDVLDLLDSRDEELVSIGAWILGELRLEFYQEDVFILRLHKLLDHENARVRFHAFGALYPALDAREPTTKTLLEKLLRDPNEGIRIAAAAAIARLT